jgi:hypothetical protein
VRQFRHGFHRPTLHDPPERHVFGDLPSHTERLAGHATIWIERLRSQPRPQDNAIGQRVTRGNAQLERLVEEPRLREHAITLQRTRAEQHGCGSNTFQQRSACDLAMLGQSWAHVLAPDLMRNLVQRRPCSCAGPNAFKAM